MTGWVGRCLGQAFEYRTVQRAPVEHLRQPIELGFLACLMQFAPQAFDLAAVPGQQRRHLLDGFVRLRTGLAHIVHGNTQRCLLYTSNHLPA